MSRAWDPKKFDSVYAEFICQRDAHFELSGPVDYSSRYRSRFKTLIKRFSDLAPPIPMDVLDIGGGQLALVCKKLWKRCSGTYVNLCSHLWRDLTLFFSPKLLSIYRCRVMLCWND